MSDGGGIRGYWSLLVLDRLMEEIADAEEELADPHYHSFKPQNLPDDVSQVPLMEAEQKRVQHAKNNDDENEKHRAFYAARRFLPCHYFDFICGTSTGA